MNLTYVILFLQHYFEMQDGVVHVFPSKDGKILSIEILMLFCPVPIKIDLVTFLRFSNN